MSICAVPTHENKYLPEWITWHRLLGVERIYFFDNSPTLEMRRLLRPWLEEGSVVLYELDYDGECDLLASASPDLHGPLIREREGGGFHLSQRASRSGASTRPTFCACARSTC